MKHGAQIPVLMLPDYRANNPYQELLVRGLAQEGVAVEFPEGYRRILPITRAVMDCRHKPDVIHLHWLSRYARGVSLLTAFLYRAQVLLDLSLARMLGPRLVWTIHNLKPHESRWPRLDRWLRRGVIRLTDRAIVHSHGAQAEFCREYSCQPEKIAIIPHGHYRDFYGALVEKGRAREILSLPQDCRLFLFFGMIRPYKGVERLLVLWKTAPHDAMLLVAGKPKNEAMREQVSTLGQQPDVRLILRRIGNKEIPLLFSAADVAVFPFRDILTSGSVALAMSYDVPVIAPRLAGIAGILGGADDLLYDPNQPDGLKQAVLKAGSMDLQPLREKTRKACDRLSWQLIARRTNNCYKAATEQ
jgi:beta-1,4-mannosyltransferase